MKLPLGKSLFLIASATSALVTGMALWWRAQYPPGILADCLSSASFSLVAKSTDEKAKVGLGENGALWALLPVGESPQRQSLLVEVPRTKVWSAVGRAFLTFTLPVLMACVGMCYLIGLAFARRLRDELELAITKLRSGELSTRLGGSRFRELSRLRQSFNEMATDIESLVNSLREMKASKDQLVRELAHDLRTPLTSLQYSCEQLLAQANGDSPDERTRGLRIALQESLFIEKVVDDLLVLSEVERLDESSGREAVEMGELLLSELERFSVIGRKQGIKLVCTSVPPVPTWINARPHLLARMIRNLVENALKHATEKVTVELGSTAGQITFVVRDDGPGFEAEALESFGKRRSGRTISAWGKQTLSLGLGSVIAMKIVDSLGGTLSASGVQDGSGAGRRGAVITVTLPAQESR